MATNAQRKLAQQIHSRFGARIADACQGTPVPPEFVAGLMANEAGKDRQGNIKENATRFEPGVFRKLQQVRDGVRRSWSHIRQVDIKTSDDEALRALATSYSLTQIMGWHCIHSLNCTVAQLRDPNQHLKYAVKLLQMNAADGDFQRKAYMGEFREWNTGSETGKTYHENYVANGLAVMEAYRQLGPPPDETVHERVEPAPADLPVRVEASGQVVQQETVVVPPATPVDNSSKKTLWATILGGIATAGTAVFTHLKEIFGYAKESGYGTDDIIRWVLIILGALFGLYILRQIIMGVIRNVGSIMYTLQSMKYHADKNSNNVVVGQPAPPKEVAQ